MQTERSQRIEQRKRLRRKYRVAVANRGKWDAQAKQLEAEYNAMVSNHIRLGDKPWRLDP